ncbi:MAG: transglutaminase domain-containing protein [Oscillospiraceae bacterium]|jgi:hypothetical protein|nr:transglutaminase domain-containing protein [Oscillospiraceae bacterium]
MKVRRILTALLAFVLLAGCSDQAGTDGLDRDGYIDRVALAETRDEAAALAEAPHPAAAVLKPEAAGKLTQENSRAVIDYSNSTDGYVMVKCSDGGKKLMVQVFGPSYADSEIKYTYNLGGDEWTTFPLSDGNGSYKVTVYENTSGQNYATLLSASFEVALADEFAPFLRPNQYVNYEENAENAIAKAAELTKGVGDPLKKVEEVYKFVVNHVTYDKEKAASVKSGYLPVLDDTLASGKGICFDYAALMTGMLRSQGVPCKLVVGYSGRQYHAWISVWTEESGWVDGAVFFDGSTWQRMDPTYISSGKNSAAIQKYVGNGKNYNAMYLY